MPVYEQRPFTVMMALRRTARLMVDELVRRLEADGYDGVQPAYHAVFENIDPEGTRLGDLAARADMTHQSMSELVASLERNGWVERRPDPSDRRARLVCLTPEGRRATRRGLHHIKEIEREWQERWRNAGYDGQLRPMLEGALKQRERERAEAIAGDQNLDAAVHR
jgi:DNA-binding MarR family transcriptional regulator